ncbi:MAG: hypothetical protein KAJ09_09105, partial [Deltaproteobacteria bacterium]|nr:hypothetical protein [Deltaproteobacteria bacterium]
FEKEKRPLFIQSPFPSSKDYSEETAKEIDEEVKRIVDETYTRAKRILVQNDTKLKKLANLLLEKEVVDEEDLKKVLDKPLAEVEKPKRQTA